MTAMKIDTGSATKVVPLAEWDDPRVQITYGIISGGEFSPNSEEHWDGYVARRIVAELELLAAPPAPDRQLISAALSMFESAYGPMLQSTDTDNPVKGWCAKAREYLSTTSAGTIPPQPVAWIARHPGLATEASFTENATVARAWATHWQVSPLYDAAPVSSEADDGVAQRLRGGTIPGRAPDGEDAGSIPAAAPASPTSAKAARIQALDDALAACTAVGKRYQEHFGAIAIECYNEIIPLRDKAIATSPPSAGTGAENADSEFGPVELGEPDRLNWPSAEADARADERERCVKACKARTAMRWAQYGITESDTGASYYPGHLSDDLETRDEEVESCAAAIRALSTATPGGR